MIGGKLTDRLTGGICIHKLKRLNAIVMDPLIMDVVTV